MAEVEKTTRHEAIVQAIAAVENRHGQLTPEAVLEAAIDPASPLHKSFTWDDETAGHAYRLDQARALIRSVRYEVHTRKTVVSSVRYVRDARAEKDAGYVNIARVDEAGLADATVESEIARATAMIQRGRGIAAALDRESEFVQAIRRVL